MMRHRDSHIPTQAVGSLALWRFLLVTWKGQFPPFCIASPSLPVEVRRVLPAALLCEPTDQETTTEDFKRLAELLCATVLFAFPPWWYYLWCQGISFFYLEKKKKSALSKNKSDGLFCAKWLPVITSLAVFLTAAGLQACSETTTQNAPLPHS